MENLVLVIISFILGIVGIAVPVKNETIKKLSKTVLVVIITVRSVLIAAGIWSVIQLVKTFLI